MRKSVVTAAAIAAAVSVLPAGTAEAGTRAAPSRLEQAKDVHAAVLSGVARAESEGTVILATNPVGFLPEIDEA